MLHFGDLIQIPVLAIRSVRGAAGATWASLDVVTGKPRRQFIGPNAPDLSLSLFFHVAFIPPRPTLTRLQQLAASGEVFQVWTESGGYWGTFELESVEHTPRWTLPTGQIIAMGVELKLVDPGLEGAVELQRPAALAGNAVDTTAAPPAEDLSRPPELITPAEIARV